jgi:cell division protein FtsB
MTNADRLDRIERILGLILSALQLDLRQGDMIMADLSKLEADVEQVKTVEASAITLLQGLKAQLDAAGTDPVKLKALSDQLEASSSDLAAAVVANTPAAP